ncbi:MAG: hypothetical protein IJP66_08120 [Kiritimatiellae bacterium]|nr:hypothetical protein [Kiritimatiellia bacterium]
MKNTLSFFASILAAAALSGCMTTVTVTTDPPGATVYSRGAGRPAYRYKYRGSTKEGEPVIFKVPYNAIKTMVVWPASGGHPATQSDEAYTKLLFNEQPVLHFVRK